MFKIIPGTYTFDGRKVPISEMVGWQELASNDQNVINEWIRLYGHKIKIWLMPTGKVNNILVLDIDVKNGENGFETIKKYDLPVTCSQNTPSGGRHYIFKYPNDGFDYGNRVRFDIGLDIRGEGGHCTYYGLDNVEIAEAPIWLLEKCRSVKKEIDLSKIAKVSAPIVEKMLEESCDNIRNAPSGESNNILNIESYKIGQLIASESVNRDYAYDCLFKAAKDRGKSDSEAMATITSGFKGGANAPTTSPFDNTPPRTDNIVIAEAKVIERWTPHFFTRYDLTNVSKLKKPQLFKDWSTEDIHITTADGGTGKTTLKLYEAICLALGDSFLGFECVTKGRTLFITGEDTREKLGAMIGAILKQNGILEDDEKTRIVMNSILVKKDSDLTIVSRSREGFYKPSSEALEKVMQAVEDFRPKLIVLDPIASFWGSESAGNDMSKAVATFAGILVERSNACVEVINHMGKESSKGKDITQFAGRGGTALPSHSRVSRVLRPLFEEEYLELTGQELGDKSAILCNVNKFSDGSPLYNKPFIILRDGYSFSRIILAEPKQKEQQNKMTDAERIFSFIAEEKISGRYVSKNVISAHFSMSGQKISKDRINQAIDFLIYQGHMGEKIKPIDNPDIDIGGKVYIITDHNGKEI